MDTNCIWIIISPFLIYLSTKKNCGLVKHTTGVLHNLCRKKIKLKWGVTHTRMKSDLIEVVKHTHNSAKIDVILSL